MDDISKAVTMDVKNPGDLVYAVGLTKDELGASEFLRYYGDKIIRQHYVGDNVPKVNADTAKRIYNAIGQATDKRLIRSSHTPTKGGLGIALAKTAFAGGYGLDIELKRLPSTASTNYSALYSESNSRFVITIDPANEAVFRKIMGTIPYNKIGVVRTDEQFNVKGVDGVEVIHDNIYDMKKDWKSTLEKVK
ncbi:Phosphoribosylformylglycinamidine synthase subunit PurL [subsurface metagenome]